MSSTEVYAADCDVCQRKKRKDDELYSICIIIVIAILLANVVILPLSYLVLGSIDSHSLHTSPRRVGPPGGLVRALDVALGMLLLVDYFSIGIGCITAFFGAAYLI
jgi:hypothetical protein